MTCTGPINITQSDGTCSLKCLLLFNYGNSTCQVKNVSDHLYITYDGDSDIIFNSAKYNPIEVRLFSPSLHTFDGSHADAELVIVHSGSSGGLLVCIPIMSTTATNASTGSVLLDNIIEGSPEIDQTTSLNLQDFNLNYLVPKSEYYSYSGTLPYGNCDISTTYNYIVFPKNSLQLNQETLSTLKSLIHNASVPIQAGTCFYNEKGTTTNGFAGEGQIYIDCQPTGEEGDIIVKELSSGTKSANMDWVFATLYILIGILLMIGGVKLFRGIIRLSMYVGRQMSTTTTT